MAFFWEETRLRFFSYSLGFQYFFMRGYDTNDSSRRLFSFTIIEDDIQETYQREVVTIMDVFSEIGGILELISVFSILLVYHY
jgi:hypothetical protein